MIDWSQFRYFTEDEMRCKCGCGLANMNKEFMFTLDSLRLNVGFPLIVNSGFRCPDYNAEVSNTGLTGPHTIGRAADLAVFGTDAFRVLECALKLNFTGIGLQQKREYTSRFIHLDNLAVVRNQSRRPWVWTY